jgi:putative ABC transport system ATP-binding protein
VSAGAVVELAGITKDYAAGETVVRALRGVDLVVRPGEMIAILGASGSGKSTLMNLVGCLDRPTSGTYALAGVRVDTHDDDALADVRNQRIGFVFQGFNLLPRATALENVALPLLYDRRRRFHDPSERAREMLRRVGIEERAAHRPNQLSGGQQQRVAIARALVAEPALLLADEPTGNLDTRTSTEVMALLQDLNAAGTTALVVTHEADVAAYCKRAITLRDGRIVSDERLAPRSAREHLAAMPEEA